MPVAEEGARLADLVEAEDPARAGDRSRVEDRMLVEARDEDCRGPRKHADTIQHARERHAGPAGDAQEAEVRGPRVPRALQDVSAPVLRLTPQAAASRSSGASTSPRTRTFHSLVAGSGSGAAGADEEPVLRNGERFRREWTGPAHAAGPDRRRPSGPPGRLLRRRRGPFPRQRLRAARVRRGRATPRPRRRQRLRGSAGASGGDAHEPHASIAAVGRFALLALLALSPLRFPTSGSPAAQPSFLRGVTALHNFAVRGRRGGLPGGPAHRPRLRHGLLGRNHGLQPDALAESGRGHGAREPSSGWGRRPRRAPQKRRRAARRDYLRAVEILFGSGDRASRDRAYAEAMGKLAASYPEDLEAATFHAPSP